jgi:hypothetical protein
VEPDPDGALDLTGECLVLLAASHGADSVRRRLPRGIARLPGPAVLVAVRTSGQPAGRLGRSGTGVFLASWARLGVRPLLSVICGVVGDDETRVRLEAGVGLPVVCGTLSWASDGRRIEVMWKEQGMTLRARAGRTVLPALLSTRLGQVREDGPVMFPARIRGLARAAAATIDVAEEVDLGWLAGRHRGALLSAGHLVMRPARQPVGLLSSLRAPALGAGQVGRSSAARTVRRPDVSIPG